MSSIISITSGAPTQDSIVDYLTDPFAQCIVYAVGEEGPHPHEMLAINNGPLPARSFVSFIDPDAPEPFVAPYLMQEMPLVQGQSVLIAYITNVGKMPRAWRIAYDGTAGDILDEFLTRGHAARKMPGLSVELGAFSREARPWNDECLTRFEALAPALWDRYYGNQPWSQGSTLGDDEKRQKMKEICKVYAVI